jgi:hypothetical protein
MQPKHPTAATPNPQIVILTATQMQQQSGQILKRAYKEKVHFVVERDGYPVVAIIPIDEYQTHYGIGTKPVAIPYASNGVSNM